jgi:hypothetical protein
VLHSSYFFFYTQVRASVPLFWSQVSDAMVPKPDVLLHHYDPLHEATRAHLVQLAARYGTPLVFFGFIFLFFTLFLYTQEKGYVGHTACSLPLATARPWSSLALFFIFYTIFLY